MTPRNHIGTGITGAVRYVLGEGRDKDNKPRTEPKNEQSRVAWLAGVNLGFEVESREDADLARRVMEFDALNQASRTKPCVKDCMHLTLSWHPSEQPTREQMIEAAEQALAALGMADAKALFVAHNDEAYAHLHIIASKINPITGRAYNLKSDRIKLSKWAERYEREFSGGIISTNRVSANQLRDAIERRDAPAVLELMMTRRATFRVKELERAIGKQILGNLEAAQFANKVLSQPDVVRLADEAGGPVTRYTTRTILEAEGQVLRAASMLQWQGHHEVSLAVRSAVLNRGEFATLSREQARAFAHAVDGKGIALIDGQAGTGKSFTISAIRQAYERMEYQVIGLAHAHKVAEALRNGGFDRGGTVLSELFALNNGRARWDDRTAIILDEAAMVDTKVLAHVMLRAQEAGAKLIMVGDDRQLSSIDHGGMFRVLREKLGAAELTEVRRQLKADDKRASELMAEGNFHTALTIYDAKGGIHWRQNQEDAREALIAKWTKDSAAEPSKTRIVFAYTNQEVDRFNAELRAIRKGRGELTGPDRAFETKHGNTSFAANDRIMITGTDRDLGLKNGMTGTVESIKGDTVTFRRDGPARELLAFNAQTFPDFRHAYAATIHKGQGDTVDQGYLYHSEHWRAAASYVSLTRHRESVDLFVARNTAPDLKSLARQVERLDDRRAASTYHQLDAPQPVRPLTATELPALELPPARKPEEQRAITPSVGPDRHGMVPQQEHANKVLRQANDDQKPDHQQTAKPRIRIRAGTTPIEAPTTTPRREAVTGEAAPQPQAEKPRVKVTARFVERPDISQVTSAATASGSKSDAPTTPEAKQEITQPKLAAQGATPPDQPDRMDWLRDALNGRQTANDRPAPQSEQKPAPQPVPSSQSPVTAERDVAPDPRGRKTHEGAREADEFRRAADRQQSRAQQTNATQQAPSQPGVEKPAAEVALAAERAIAKPAAVPPAAPANQPASPAQPQQRLTTQATPQASEHRPLNANEIAASANDPALRARYNKQTEQREAQRAKAPEPAKEQSSRAAPAGTERDQRREMSDAERVRFERMARQMNRANDERENEKQNQLNGGRGGRHRSR